ncbi:benzoate/H(+) symporter BenE family transporter [Clostridium bovifaecis]|uniref:Benzoate/H(+) symporter BenE family transporter n=1 Tax=Clostridium bovifaecis TaxID=2184719 RepID=A0A6I6EX10_9CLOT|nr:benzoate/H(+) symporter BenE family transporter [Clostridium bovifaecis]
METSVVTKKKGLIEKGTGFRAGIKSFTKDVSAKSATAGVIAAIFGCTGPALVTINAAKTVGFTTEQTVSWLFGIYVFGGLISLIMGAYYKKPIVGAFSIPGAAMLATSLAGFSFQEAAAAFMIAGLIDLLLGVTGVMGKVMKWLPLPIVMGMIAGAMIRFGTGIVTSTKDAPIIGGAALIGYFIIPKIIKKFPPILGALILGIVTTIITGDLKFASEGLTYIAPQIVTPSFNISTILSVSVPLAALVVGAENAQAIGVLYAQDYEPPVNSMTIISGIGGMLSGLVGAHNANIAGPMTAICSSEDAGVKEKRYTAAIVNGFCFIAFGLFSSITMAFVQALPSALINILAGLAMISVLISSFKDAFASSKCKMGAFAALVIAMSGISILKIGSAFWALLVGVIISLIVEKKDFDQAK